LVLRVSAPVAEEELFSMKKGCGIPMEHQGNTIPGRGKELRIGRVKAGRILFLGNSITLHGPSAEVDWSGNWGMAASALDKDYVHVLVRAITERTGRDPEILAENIADFERHHETCDIRQMFKKHLEFKADLVIVAIGENVPVLDTEKAQRQFKDCLVQLLTLLKANGNPALVVRSCFMPDETHDRILKQACTEVGGIFVDISHLSKDESNYARSERQYTHAGVAGHPGDRGMREIADAILNAVLKI
jgi:hypothetical protein